ncbi:hypothetical protein ACSS31_00010 [Priestia megaterium]
MLAEAGQHWKFAMDHPDQTKPQMDGKKIPGAVGDSTLDTDVSETSSG